MSKTKEYLEYLNYKFGDSSELAQYIKQLEAEEQEYYFYNHTEQSF